MPHWFLLGVLVALVSAFVNILDKHILTKYVKHPKDVIRILGIFSILFVAVFFLTGYTADLFNLTNDIFWFSFFGGVFEAVYIFFYLRAIDKEGLAFMIPLFALGPIFSLLPAWILLGETVSLIPLLGIIMVLIGLILLAWSRSGSFVKPSKYYWLMVAAALFYAVSSVFLGKGDQEYTFLDNLIVSRLGVFIGCIYILFLCRHLVFKGLLNYKGYVYFVSEAMYLFSVWLFIAAISNGPVAYVMGVTDLQPVIVLLISILLWKFVPKFLAEKNDVQFKVKWTAVVAILIVMTGSTLLYI